METMKIRLTIRTKQFISKNRRPILPTYEYQCQKCNLEFEAFDVKYDRSNEPMECPECQGSIKKMMSAPSFDIIGYCYMNEYGKHAWKKNMSQTNQGHVLAGNKDPY